MEDFLPITHTLEWLLPELVSTLYIVFIPPCIAEFIECYDFIWSKIKY